MERSVIVGGGLKTRLRLVFGMQDLWGRDNFIVDAEYVALKFIFL